MKPHKTAGLLIALALASGILLATIPTGSAQAQLAITSAAVPSSVTPGTTGVVQATLKNVGTETARIDIRHVAADGGLVINGSKTTSIGSLGKTDSTTVSPFTYWVPSTTAPGIYRAEFMIDYRSTTGGATTFNSVPFDVTVTVTGASSLHLGPLAPATLQPGQSRIMNLTVTNSAQTTITLIQGTWTDTTSTLTSMGSGNAIFVPALGPESSITVPIEIAAPSTASAGIYTLAFALTYRDSGGAIHDLATNFSINLRAPSLLSVALDEWQDDSITLSVSNVGIGRATAVEVRLLSGGPVASRPAAAVFLGNLDPGDHTTATFSPATPSDGGGPLRVEVSFTDADGQRQVSTHDMDLGEAPAVDDAGPGATEFALLALAVAAVLGTAWYWRRTHRSSRGR